MKNNQAVVIESLTFPKLTTKLEESKLYFNKIDGSIHSTYWIESNILNELEIDDDEKVHFEKYLDCPICNSYVRDIFLDYRTSCGVTSAVPSCYDCKVEDKDIYNKLKSMSNDDKLDYVKKTGLVANE